MREGHDPHNQRPPIPLPTGAKLCPQCGHELMAGATHCPQCGRRVAATSCFSILGSIILALLALLLGGFGACSVFVSVPVMLGPSRDADILPLFLMGLGACYLALLCVRRIVRSGRGL